MITDPMRHKAHPNFPSVPKSSLRKYDPSTAPIKTLSAPNGVTSMAGAKAYAAKLATSPSTMVTMPPHHVGLLKYAKPSPSNPCRSLASSKPFLVMTKLVPMAIVDSMAKAKPTYLSSTILAWLEDGLLRRLDLSCGQLF